MATFASTLLLSGLLAGGALADTSIVVPAGTRLDVQTMGGSIVVDTWNRNEIRIDATYGSRDRVTVTRAGEVVRVRSESQLGSAAIVDYRITVPASMDLELSSVQANVTVNGVQGQVRANTVQGRVDVRGGRGQISVESVQGRVLVEGARGRVDARGVAGEVRLRDVEGDVNAQTVSGRTVLENVRGANVTGTSVSGAVYFDGTIAPGGRYRFASHSGTVTMAAPDNLNATITLATFAGSISSTLSGVTLPATQRGQRVTATAGGGSAVVELESFSGSLRLARRGEVQPPGPAGQ
jgi:DUF4097 and DUF4098 domain-containing protein YvlB